MSTLFPPGKKLNLAFRIARNPMAMRTDLAALVADWNAAGGSEPLPTIQVRLKANNRPAQKLKTATRS